MACHPGLTIAFDNTDIEINTKNMTMSKQNRDIHWVNHKMFVNRVSGNFLSSEGPRCDLSTVPNSTFLPSVLDQQRQRFKAGGGGLVTDFPKFSTVVRISWKMVLLLILVVLFSEGECCAEGGGGRAYPKKLKSCRVQGSYSSSENILGWDK